MIARNEKSLLNYADLRMAARARLPRGLFEFIDRGTEDEHALSHNKSVLSELKLVPRVLRDVSSVSCAATLLGEKCDAPVVVAPTGSAGLAWHKGELALASAASKENVPFVISTASLTPMEEIIERTDGCAWFQLYIWPDKEESFRLVERARKAGFTGLMVTVDTVVTPNREYNVRNGFSIPLRPNLRNIMDSALHPTWTCSVVLRYLLSSGLPRHENYPEHLRNSLISKPKAPAATAGKSTVTWEDLERLRQEWPGKLVVKGILDPDDAAQAIGMGIDAIVVSNHGGRNLDSAVSPLTQLPVIRAAVGKDATLLVDSGFTRGSDVVKAIALGADGVMLGRMPLWGAAVNGEAGARHALQIIRNEILRTMSFIGATSLGALGRGYLSERAVTDNYSRRYE
ncbi:MAG: alpha-hydroxy acid oxidase [Alcaligenaceae bacterium]|nr:alpha-hydroxy acid oxidase [Alcaligenaceae bacterium]